MKKYLLLFGFLLPVTLLIAQRTEKKNVSFKNLRGFSGTVSFDVTYNGFATVLAGKRGVLILEKYDASNEDLNALLKAGYDLRGFPESGYTPGKYSFVVQGQAKIGMLSAFGSTDNKATGLSKLQLGESLGDFTTPEFKEGMKDAVKKVQQKTQKSHWEETGSFTDLKVTELYISEFEETIRKILGKAAETRRFENAEDAAAEAQKAMMFGNLSQAKRLLDKAYKLDPQNKTMISASREYAAKKKEQDEKEARNLLIQAELDRQQRERDQAAAEARELQTLRSWKAGSSRDFSAQNQARLNELTKREQERSVAKINDIFEEGRERIRERSRQRMAEIDAEYERSIAELQARSAREKKEVIDATRREKEAVRKEQLLYEEARLAKYGYTRGESDAQMKANVRRMAAEIHPDQFKDGLAPLKYFKYGYVNREGDIIVPFKYDRAGEFADGLAAVAHEDIYLGNLYEERNRRAGYINTSGREVIPLKYQVAWDFRNGRGVVAIDEKYGTVNTSGAIVIPLEYQFFNYTDVGLIKAKKNNRFGFLDERTGKPVIPVQYEHILNFRGDLVAAKSNGKWGFLNSKGSVAIPFRFDEIKNGGLQDGQITVVESGITTTINRFGKRVDYFVVAYKRSEGMTPIGNKNYEYGFLNEAEEMVIPPQYSDYTKFKDGISIVKKDGLWGCIDRNGKVVIPLQYKSLSESTGGLLRACNKSDQWGFFDKSGKEAIPFIYERLTGFDENTGLAVARKKGKYGVIDLKGKTKIPFKYDGMSGYALARLGLIEAEKDDKTGYLDARGKTVIAIKYDKVASSFYGGHTAILMKDGKLGIFNEKGEEQVEVKYDYISRFEEGLAMARLNGKYGFIDSIGNAVVPFKYDTAYSFRKGFAEVWLNGESLIVDKNGVVQAGKEFIRISNYHEGIAMAMQHGKYAFVDENEKLITPFKYDFMRYFEDGMGMIGIDTRSGSRLYGFVDRSGTEVIPPKYDNFKERYGKYHTYHYFEDGLVEAELNKKHGYINKQGKEVIPVIYHEVGTFSEGLVRVANHGLKGFSEAQTGKWGYFDRTGKKLIDFRFTTANDFSDGYAKVQIADNTGFIDHSGEVVIPFSKKYKRLDDFIGGAAIAYNGEAWGFINKEGKEVLPFEYTDISTGNGYIALESNGKYGVVDVRGKTVIPFRYTQLYFDLGGLMTNDKITDFVISKESDKTALIRLEDGKAITTNRFDLVSLFNGDELTTFRIGEKFGVLDREGREILPPIYQSIRLYGNLGFLAVCYDEKWGIANRFGGIVIPIKYDAVYRSEGKIVAAMKSGDEDFYDPVRFEKF